MKAARGRGQLNSEELGWRPHKAWGLDGRLLTLVGDRCWDCRAGLEQISNPKCVKGSGGQNYGISLEMQRLLQPSLAPARSGCALAFTLPFSPCGVHCRGPSPKGSIFLKIIFSNKGENGFDPEIGDFKPPSPEVPSL